MGFAERNCDECGVVFKPTSPTQKYCSRACTFAALGPTTAVAPQPTGRPKLFLIHPVRGHVPADTAQTVFDLVGEGFDVYWPIRDTNQDDAVGLNICRHNRSGIDSADVVGVIWDGLSKGCLFDLGMAFAMRKPILIIKVPSSTEGKSFQNMMRAWAKEGA